MLELARHSDMALSFESAIDGTATIGRRGINSWTLEVTGETGHSGGIFGADRGSGAVYEAARILAAFQAELGAEKYLTLNPSVIVGGTKAALDDYRGKRRRQDQRDRAGGLRPRRHPLHQPRPGALGAASAWRPSSRGTCRGRGATLRFDDGAYPPMTPTPANEALLQVLDEASRDLGLGPVAALDPAKRGAGDIGFIAHLLPCLDGLGSGGGENTHAPGEYTGLDTLTPMAQRAAVLIHRLGR